MKPTFWIIIIIGGACQTAVTAAVHILIAESNYEALQAQTVTLAMPTCLDPSSGSSLSLPEANTGSLNDQPALEGDSLILDFSLPERHAK